VVRVFLLGMRFLLILLLLSPLVHAQSSVIFEKSLDKSVVSVGEPVKVTLYIKNTGTEVLRDVEIEDRVALPNFNYNYMNFLSALSPGEEVPFAYSIIPLKEGNYTLEPASLSFYDPVAKKRVTVKSEPLLLVVVERPQNNLSSQNQSFGEFTNETNETRLYYVKKKRGIGLGDIAKYSFLGFLLALPFAYLVYRYSKRRGKEVAQKYESKVIEPVRDDFLTRAKKLYYSGRVEEAFELISRKIKSFLAEKYSLKESSTLREILREVEKDGSLSERDREALKSNLMLVEKAAFAGYKPEPEEFQQLIFCMSRVLRERWGFDTGEGAEK